MGAFQTPSLPYSWKCRKLCYEKRNKEAKHLTRGRKWKYFLFLTDLICLGIKWTFQMQLIIDCYCCLLCVQGLFWYISMWQPQLHNFPFDWSSTLNSRWYKICSDYVVLQTMSFLLCIILQLAGALPFTHTKARRDKLIFFCYSICTSWESF